MSLRLEAVHKTYPNGIEALRGVDMTIPQGEVFGLVGPNGAGKSTLLKTACGLLRAESGRIFYEDHDITGNPQRAASFIGLMPDPLGVYTDVTAADYLEFFARVLNIPEADQQTRIGEVVEELELSPWLDEEVETLSAGWQRRLALGRILLAQTPVLLLDEPAAGLDVAARKELLEIVRRLANHNRAIVISSHILPELEDLADRFGIITEGAWRDISPGKTFFTRQELAHGLGTPRARIRCSNLNAALTCLTQAGYAATCTQSELHLICDRGDEQLADAVATLCRANHRIYEATALTSGLGELVLHVLNGSVGDNS